jgi:UDP-N-acetylglucosamine transferase subunit ALG13
LIFVTVGTSLPHDELIQRIDELARDGKITDVIAQVGAGHFHPKHIESFRFAPNLEEYYDKAEIVISNCGAGTIMENVTRGRRLVAIQNPDVTGGHEWELVTKMEKGKHLIWCKSLDELAECIERARNMRFEKFEPERLDLSDVIKSLLRST